jgi:hypothetical protein
MIEAYEGMCQLINKTGACGQCRGLRELAPESNQGPDLVQIEVKPGVRPSLSKASSTPGSTSSAPPSWKRVEAGRCTRTSSTP